MHFNHQSGSQGSTQRKNYNNRMDSSNTKQRRDLSQNYSISKGMASANTQSNAYIGQPDLMKERGGVNNFRHEMKRNESKSSANFQKEQIRQHENRMMRLKNDNYVLDSPEIGQRKVNNKAGVQLAPMNHQPHIAAGRSSMMSINGDNE